MPSRMFSPSWLIVVTFYPPVPNVAFFDAYEAVAFNLWKSAELSSEEEAALEKAVETSNKDVAYLEWIYTLGEQTLFQNVAKQLKHKGLLVKVPKGWQVCGQTFDYITQIDDKYCEDEDFRHMLLKAAGISTTQSCGSAYHGTDSEEGIKVSQLV